MPQEVMLVGGPGHGLWWPVGGKAIAYRTSVYYGHRIAVEGWRFTLPVYIWAPILSVPGTMLEPGKTLPGYIIGGEVTICIPCRWCYAPARPNSILCGSPECNSFFASVAALDILTADDAKNWVTGASEEN